LFAFGNSAFGIFKEGMEGSEEFEEAEGPGESDEIEETDVEELDGDIEKGPGKIGEGRVAICFDLAVFIFLPFLCCMLLIVNAAKSADLDSVESADSAGIVGVPPR
jgi:hypothetical protein